MIPHFLTKYGYITAETELTIFWLTCVLGLLLFVIIMTVTGILIVSKLRSQSAVLRFLSASTKQNKHNPKTQKILSPDGRKCRYIFGKPYCGSGISNSTTNSAPRAPSSGEQASDGLAMGKSSHGGIKETTIMEREEENMHPGHDTDFAEGMEPKDIRRDKSSRRRKPIKSDEHQNVMNPSCRRNSIDYETMMAGCAEVPMNMVEIKNGSSYQNLMNHHITEVDVHMEEKEEGFFTPHQKRMDHHNAVPLHPAEIETVAPHQHSNYPQKDSLVPCKDFVISEAANLEMIPVIPTIEEVQTQPLMNGESNESANDERENMAKTSSDSEQALVRDQHLSVIGDGTDMPDVELLEAIAKNSLESAPSHEAPPLENEQRVLDSRPSTTPPPIAVSLFFFFFLL